MVRRVLSAELVLGLLASALLPGCPPTVREQCAPGYIFNESFTECVPDTRVDAGPTDAGPVDGGMADGGTPDAFVPVDGGPCSRCPAARPVCVADACVECMTDAHCASSAGGPNCDPDTNTCVGCVDRGDCAAPTPACVMNECVACDAASDCTAVGASRCDATTNACAACAADADCTHLSATPVCDEGRGTCVACTGDTEAARCGANSCRRSDGVCTGTARGSRDVCDSCEADSECVTGRRCVNHVFGGTDLGGFCFLDATGGCGDTVSALRPYRTPTELTSVDGALATYCMPPTSTTCAGIRDTQSTTCTTSSDCGVVGLDDGYCPAMAPSAGTCTYRCAGSLDCDELLNCGGSPQRCRP